MKTNKWLLGAVMALVCASSAFAHEAEELVPKAEAKPVGYDNGFYISNADGDFKLKINGRLQPQYFFEKGRLGVDSVNTFRVRRAMVRFSGDMGKYWSFSSLYQNATSSNQAVSTLFWEASLNYHPSSLFNIEMGMVTPPMDRFGQVSSGEMMFVEAPLSSTQADGIQDLSISRPEFGLTDGLGVVMGGSLNDKFLYGLSATNGNNPAGTQLFTSNFNKRMSGSARLQYNILKDPGFMQSDLAWSESPALAIGTGGAYVDQGGADTYATNVYFRYNLQGSADIAFKYKGLSIQTEWYGRIQYCSTIGTNTMFTLHDAGYYAIVGYFVIPKKLEIAGEVSQVFREGPHNNSSEFIGGINWYIIGNSIKWQNNIGSVKDFDTVDGTQGERLWRVWSMITMNI